MKVLNYIKTASGSKIATSITEVFIDPLETKNTATESVKKQPEFKELQARISAYDRYITGLKKDGVKLGSPSAIPKNIQKELRIKLNNVKGAQDKMYELQAQAMIDHPIYLVPNDAILISDETAEEFEQIFKKGGVFIKLVDLQADTLKYVEVPDMTGKRYRLPETLDWINVIEPGHEISDNAVFTDPEPAEAERIEEARIKAMSEAERQAEALQLKADAEQLFLRVSTLAELEGSDEDIQKKKAGAKEDYHNTIESICDIYGVTI